MARVLRKRDPSRDWIIAVVVAAIALIFGAAMASIFAPDKEPPTTRSAEPTVQRTHAPPAVTPAPRTRPMATPAPRPRSTPAPAASTGAMVYVATESGECYHLSRGCRSLAQANAVATMTLSAAQGRGLRPCRNCCR